MGKKKAPKQKPTEQEKALASVGVAEYGVYKNLYLGSEKKPGALLSMRNQAQSEDFSNLFMARAGADLAQASGQQSSLEKYSGLLNTSFQKDSFGTGLASANLYALTTAKEANVEQTLKVLAAARKQASASGENLSRSAKLAGDLAIDKFKSEEARKAEQFQIVSEGAKDAASMFGGAT